MAPKREYGSPMPAYRDRRSVMNYQSSSFEVLLASLLGWICAGCQGFSRNSTSTTSPRFVAPPMGSLPPELKAKKLVMKRATTAMAGPDIRIQGQGSLYQGLGFLSSSAILRSRRACLCSV